MDKVVVELLRIARGLNRYGKMDDRCPLPLKDNALNIKNHLVVIKEHGLGPVDPRDSSMEFWQAKAKTWKTTEGDARGRLCLNCEHYLETTEIAQCIDNGPALNFKASDLPLTPKLADVESKPTAFCMLYNITCSPTRTCDSQEMGGPIDDVKARVIELAGLADDKLDLDEYENPF